MEDKVCSVRPSAYLGNGLLQCCRLCLIFRYRYCIWHGQREKKNSSRLACTGWRGAWAQSKELRRIGTAGEISDLKS
jgi:hypothetical protein